MSRLSLSQLVLLSIEEQRLALDEINQQLEQKTAIERVIWALEHLLTSLFKLKFWYSSGSLFAFAHQTISRYTCNFDRHRLSLSRNISIY